MNPTSIAADTIVEEITINAPAGRVFDAFINPSERVVWWTAPDGRFRTTHMDSDLRPGGKWEMRGTRADGSAFSVIGEYRAVERPTLLVFTWLPDWQGDAIESLVRVEFAEAGGVTRVRLTHSGLASERSRTSHRGWPQILAQLKAYADAR
ncbi:MAG TPA: SRPBCC domain-containing protein [Vicinamibacterales bacterium]|nr:SRPBCC domain-containing protein [Vicinamibacterales bacterium]